MKRTLLFCAVFLLVNNCVFSQNSSTNYLPNYDPPSPEASALGKFIDHPVGNFTGTNEVDIPLFDVKVGRIDLPISLSYHGSGVKVNDVSSRIGAGWVLNAGGVITRTVNNLPDDGGDGIGGSQGNTYIPYFQGGSSSTISVTYDQGNPTFYDLDPDEFYYIFGGKMGKMLFKDATHPVLVNDDPLQIKGPFTGNNSFVITDEKGIVYTFQNIEVTSVANPSNSYEYTSSWFITSIYDPVSNQTVNFQYRSELPYLNYSYPKSSSANIPGLQVSGTNQDITTVQILQSMVLSKITYSNGFIEFDANLNRTDLTGDLAYTKISQYINLNNTPSLLKSYNLGHTTTTAGTNAPQEGNRLFLDTLQETGSDGTLLPPYLFYYNNRTALPARNSLQQDMWGYYNANGAVQNNGVLQFPNVYIHNYGTKADYLPFDNAADPAKTVIGNYSAATNPTTAVYGALSEVMYPTKGYTTYTYEVNQFSAFGNNYTGGGVRIKTINDYDVSGQLLLSRSYAYSSGFIPGPLPQVAFPLVTNPINASGIAQFNLNQTVLGSSQGSYVGYGVVTVTQNGSAGTNNGVATYMYSADADIAGTPTPNGYSADPVPLNSLQAETYYPFFEMQSTEERRGHLIEELYADLSGNNKKTIQYSYALTSNPLIQVNSNYMSAIIDGLNNPSITTNMGQTRYINAEKELLTAKIESDWPSQTNQQAPMISKTTTYDYCGGPHNDLFIRDETVGNENISAPQQVSTASSKQTMTTTNYYPFDYSIAASNDVMGYMVAMNYIDPVINKVNWVTYNSGQVTGSYFVSSQINDYMLNPNTPATPISYQVVPKQIFTLNSSDPYPYYPYTVGDPSNPGPLYERRLSFNNYDSQSNVLDVVQDAGPRISYQWGYSNTMPVAKVTNAVNMQNSTSTEVTQTGMLPINLTTNASTSFTTTTAGNITIAIQTTGAPNNPFLVGYNLNNAFGTVNNANGTLCFAFNNSSYCSPTETSTVTFSNMPAGTYTLSTTFVTVPSGGTVPASLAYTYNGSQTNYSGTKDFFYDSFEEGDGSSAVGDAKTGQYSWNGTYTYTKALTGLDNGSYILSYWQKVSGNWVLNSTPETVSNNAYNISITGQIDDVRFYPANAQISIFTYDPLLRVEAITDPGNKIRSFQYDPFSRLLNVGDNNNNVLTHNTYHYQGQ
jgi:hypothetical protein